jgi:hypothetical protein
MINVSMEKATWGRIKDLVSADILESSGGGNTDVG